MRLMNASLVIDFLAGQALLIAIATWIIKRLVERTIDSAVSASFEKQLEQYKDTISRAQDVRKQMLAREMEFFDATDSQFAELIPLIQDLAKSVEIGSFSKYYKQCYVRYFEITLELKNIVLRYHPYISRAMFDEYSALVSQLQTDAEQWEKNAELLSSGKETSKEQRDAAEWVCEALLQNIAYVRFEQKRQMEDESKPSE